MACEAIGRIPLKDETNGPFTNFTMTSIKGEEKDCGITKFKSILFE